MYVENQTKPRLSNKQLARFICISLLAVVGLFGCNSESTPPVTGNPIPPPPVAENPDVPPPATEDPGTPPPAHEEPPPATEDPENPPPPVTEEPDDPPPANDNPAGPNINYTLRQPAEFEPLQAVMVYWGPEFDLWGKGTTYEIIKIIADNIKAVVLVADEATKYHATERFQANNINMDNVEFLTTNGDLEVGETRDYGPWFAFNTEGKLSVVNHTYDGPGDNAQYAKENQVPKWYGEAHNMPVMDMPLATEGGNYMTDGQGISLQVELIYEANNNSLNKEQIAAIQQEYLGIQMTHITPNSPNLIHVDTHAKFLKPDVLMINRVPSNHENYNEIEGSVQYMQQQTSAYGTPYKIFRLDTPNDEPYPNSLIMNNIVMVPIVDPDNPGDSDFGWGSMSRDEIIRNNEAALESYRNAMPGYEVMGFNGPWVKGDALHCRTKQIPDQHMLYIDHTPLKKQTGTAEGYQVWTKIIPYSGESIVDDKTVVHWRVAGGTWSEISLQAQGDGNYSAMIPQQLAGTEIEYYIHAADNSGRAENHPYIGALWAHTFIVE